MGRFLKKCHTEYFLIYHFGKPLGCPATSHQWFTRTTKFGKLALKKGCDGVSLQRRTKLHKTQIFNIISFLSSVCYPSWTLEFSLRKLGNCIFLAFKNDFWKMWNYYCKQLIFFLILSIFV
jgi:hypothetical protein